MEMRERLHWACVCVLRNVILLSADKGSLYLLIVNQSSVHSLLKRIINI